MRKPFDLPHPNKTTKDIYKSMAMTLFNQDCPTIDQTWLWLLWVLEANTKKWNSSCCRQAAKKLQQRQQNCYGIEEPLSARNMTEQKLHRSFPIKLPLVGQTDKEFLWQQQVQLQITPYRNPPQLSSCCWLRKSFAWASVTWRRPRLACIGRWLPVSWLCGLTLPKLRFVFTYQEVWTTCIKNSVLLDSCSLITSHKIWASSSHTTCLNKQRDTS